MFGAVFDIVPPVAPQARNRAFLRFSPFCLSVWLTLAFTPGADWLFRGCEPTNSSSSAVMSAMVTPDSPRERTAPDCWRVGVSSLSASRHAGALVPCTRPRLRTRAHAVAASLGEAAGASAAPLATGAGALTPLRCLEENHLFSLDAFPDQSKAELLKPSNDRRSVNARPRSSRGAVPCAFVQLEH